MVVLLVLEDLPLDTDGILVGIDKLLGLVAVQRLGAVDGGGAILGAGRRGDAGPEDDAVGPGVAGRDAVREGEVVGLDGHVAALPRATLDVGDVDAQTVVAPRRTGVVEVAVQGGGGAPDEERRGRECLEETHLVPYSYYLVGGYLVFSESSCQSRGVSLPSEDIYTTTTRGSQGFCPCSVLVCLVSSRLHMAGTPAKVSSTEKTPTVHVA